MQAEISTGLLVETYCQTCVLSRATLFDCCGLKECKMKQNNVTGICVYMQNVHMYVDPEGPSHGASEKVLKILFFLR